MKKHELKMMILAAIFAALTAIGAFLQVPLGFTSITLQTFFAFMAAVLLGPKWAMLSQLVYVLLGVFGLPIFTQGGGFGYFLKPSMGFLIGLIPMAAAVGAIAKGAEKKKLWYLQISAALLMGEVIIYLIGTPYMGLILNLYMGKSLSIGAIVRTGCLIYLPGDMVKIVVTVLLYMPLMKSLKAAKVI